MKWRKILSSLLSPLPQKIPSHIKPNHITVISFFIFLTVGLFVYLTKYSYFFFIGAILSMLLFGASDSLDGLLARTRNQTTKCGSFLDQTLDKIGWLFLLFSLILGELVRADLVVVAMLLSLFYSFINFQAEALVSNRFPETDRPRWFIITIAFCLIGFFIKLMGLETFTLGAQEVHLFDLIFSLLPIYLFVTILLRTISLWKILNKLDQEKQMR